MVIGMGSKAKASPGFTKSCSSFVYTETLQAAAAAKQPCHMPQSVLSGDERKRMDKILKAVIKEGCYNSEHGWARLSQVDEQAKKRAPAFDPRACDPRCATLKKLLKSRPDQFELWTEGHPTDYVRLCAQLKRKKKRVRGDDADAADPTLATSTETPKVSKKARKEA